MNYIDEFAIMIGSLCGMEWGGCTFSDKRLLRMYALLGLVRGTSVTSKDVHDAWSAWCSDERPTHPSLIPFEQLSEEKQRLDDEYKDAILFAVGKKWNID